MCEFSRDKRDIVEIIKSSTLFPTLWICSTESEIKEEALLLPYIIFPSFGLLKNGYK